MKKLTLLIAIFLFFGGNSFARAKYQGVAEKGGKVVKTSTTVSYKLNETYPSCTVTVYLTGTTNLATIYSDNSGSVQANPFTANSDGSYSFYADNGRYDIKFSGTGILTPFTKADIIIADLAESFFVTNFGAKCDNIVNDKSSIQTLMDYVGAAGGGIITSNPRLHCYIGSAAQGRILSANYDNIKFRDLNLTYSSANRTATFGSGSAIFAGDQFISNVADGFEFSNGSITDLNATTLYSGAGPGGITVYNSDNILIDHNSFTNIKAGAAIIYVGALSGINPTSKNVTISNNIIGGVIEGDGINTGNAINNLVDHNNISGVLRHGIEGGNFRRSAITRNIINMQNQGLTGIATIYGDEVDVSGNFVYQWVDGSSALDLAQDANIYPITNIKVIGNTFTNTITTITAGTPALRFQPVAGTAANLLGPVTFANNTVKSVTPIEIYASTTIIISTNTFNKLANNGSLINNNTGANPAIGTSDLIDIEDNIISSGLIVKWPDANWKNKRIRFHNNSIGYSSADSATDAVDGNLNITYNPGLITAVAMSSVTQTSTFTGALVGDKILVTTDTALPIGCSVWVEVTAGDTLSWRVINSSGADQTVGSTVFRFWLDKR